jgi:hypothetical protein
MRKRPSRIKEAAYYQVARAKRDGQLALKPCEICGAKPAECHHIDHSDQLRVMWLCHKHHMQTHSQFGKPAPDWFEDIRAAMKKIDAARLASRAARAFNRRVN